MKITFDDQIEGKEEDFNAALVSQLVSPKLYYFCTLSLFIADILCALICDDLTLVFGFYAAFVESLLNFLLPGLFYICSFRVLRKKPTSFFFLVVSYIYILIGIVLFIGMNINNILKIRDSLQ